MSEPSYLLWDDLTNNCLGEGTLQEVQEQRERLIALNPDVHLRLNIIESFGIPVTVRRDWPESAGNGDDVQSSPISPGGEKDEAA